MKKILLILLITIIFISLILVVVNFMRVLDFDDVDPQISSSIQYSNHAGFFVAKYDTLYGEHSSIKVNEVWVEHVWYNKLTFFTQSTRKERELQLVLTLDSVMSRHLKLINHENWEFVNKSNWRVFGKENIGADLRNCNISIDSILPDTLIILLKRRAYIDDSFKVISEITLIKR